MREFALRTSTNARPVSWTAKSSFSEISRLARDVTLNRMNPDFVPEVNSLSASPRTSSRAKFKVSSGTLPGFHFCGW